ncbi:uncharacterized protein B0H64DRAFT_378022 [Chaetomium fimeti]|uniref:Uncharacterized protein n=1 Tax=Chaetomium fimeti TaxID=1854472 RepID=A0AAE0H7J4_9PEZI|nr:hypothetical protein B0H64DRAFT_378022 [Chaetomium fimeti]
MVTTRSRTGCARSHSPTHNVSVSRRTRSRSPMKHARVDVLDDQDQQLQKGSNTTDDYPGGDDDDNNGTDYFGDDEGEEDLFEYQEDDEEDDPDTFITPELFDIQDFTPETDAAAEPQDDLHDTTTEEDTARFEMNILKVVKFMKSWVNRVDSLSELQEAGYLSSPMKTGWFNAVKDDTVTGPQLLSFVPTKVKAILGRKKLGIADLMQLPGLGLNCTDREGSYLALPARKVQTSNSQAAHPPSHATATATMLGCQRVSDILVIVAVDTPVNGLVL